MSGQKRISVKLQKPNPLFEQWLTEWRDEAIKNGSKMQHCFSKALTSLRKYPLPLSSGQNCKVLEGFGDRLCILLDRKLAEYKKNNGGLSDTVLQVQTNATRKRTPPNKQGTVATKKQRVSGSPRIYVPGFRSGGYAILVALYKESLRTDYEGFMLKKDLMKKGQVYCDKSFTKPDPGTFYTAWYSMRTLLDKSLVVRSGNPAKFSLTEEGLELARKLNEQREKDDEGHTTVPDVGISSIESIENCLPMSSSTKDALPSTSCLDKPTNRKLSKKTVSTSSISSLTSENSTQSTSQEETAIFAPQTFDIILIVDTQETSGAAQKDDDPMLYELTNLKVPHEVRHLKAGDYTWICRSKTTKQELILPYIIERKRVDDFGASIKDGRFYEQKFRLKQCGLRNLIYLIESFGQNTHTGLPMATLRQAAVNTAVQDGFAVKFTDGLRGSAEYLSCLTSILISMYQSKTLVSSSKDEITKATNTDDDISVLMHFKDFNKSASKNKHFKVKDLFVKQLLQLKGVSVDKALAIVDKYPTPHSLMSAYKEVEAKEGEKLLSTITYGKLSKKIGLVISRTLYQLYTQETF